jgi:mono/diheme cytochrome c family protein
MAAATDRRIRQFPLVLASLLFMFSNAVTGRAESGVARGEALYGNHCVTCHTCKAHTRRDPAVKNMSELVREVDRWQANQQLGWTPEERATVVEYLNRTFYRF